ncbi:MAG: adenine phosphoribosyltransferase [Oscillospiraceae bacterium]|jgi:adenine phosphoribosyltransferase|nr:adenine phosphoribosyltransferase [Oscillospiraceae bacterium]
MENTYTLQVAGLTRKLRYFPLGNGLYIAGFVMFGDIELTERCAGELHKICPPYDILITAESKGIPLAYEMAKQRGDGTYLVARKQKKLYMSGVISADVQSITTAARQTLHIDGEDAEKIKGRRVLIVDDVISTGESVLAVERLVEMAGGTVAGRAAVLAEGRDAIAREDIAYLAPLPLFTQAEVMGK